MKKKYISHVKRYYRHYALFILFLFLLLIISSWLFVRHYKPILSQRLKEQVYIATDSLYRVTFSEVHFNPVLGKFTLDSFHLIPDTNTYNRLKREHRAPANLFDLFVGAFQLRRMHVWSLIFNKKVNIGVIKAENPVVTIYHKHDEERKNTETIRGTLFNLTSGPLSSIQIDHLGLHNISLVYKNKQKANSGDFRLKNMELIFRNIKIDSSTLKDTTRFLFATDIWFHLDKSRIYTSDSLYVITTGGIGFSVVEEKATIKELKVIPRLNEQEFDRRLTYRKNRFAVSIDSLLLEGLSLEELQDRKWHIKKVNVRNSNADIYLNRGVRLEPVEKPLPQKTLRLANISLLIDTLRLHNVNIKYREFNPASGRVGYVTFEKTHGTVSNITNDSLQIRKNKFCKADLHTFFMGQGKLHTFFDFNLADSNNAFTYKGHLGYLSAPVLNPATRPLGLVRIKSGRIHSLDYHFNADNSGAYGTVALQYDRLGISVLSINEETGSLKKKGLLSLAANLLVLKDNNMYDSLALRHTDVSYQREPYRSVFNLMWKSIFSGVKVMAGMDKQTEEQIRSLKQTGEQLKGKGNRKKKDKEEGSFFQKARNFLDKTLSKPDKE